jgi:uncharacterized membrane protein
MFEFLFKYPAAMFHRGTFLFSSGLPVWALIATSALVLVALGVWIWRNSAGSPRAGGWRAGVIWLLQGLVAALLLFMIWRPALSVSTLRAQQNIVAVVLDSSLSMAMADEGGQARLQKAIGVLNGGLMRGLEDKFQVRLYKMGDHLERVDNLTQVSPQSAATHIGEGLKQVVADAASLPIGAMVLMSDGADNSGGVDLETLAEIRRQRIPVHTIGFGREKMSKDIEIDNVDVPARALPDSRLSAIVTFHQNGYTGQKAKITVRDGQKVLATHTATLKAEGTQQTESVLFNAGTAGVKSISTSIDPMPNEENLRNNSVLRLVNVDQRKPRILYLEGEPRWEYKFLRRAVEDDRSIELASMVRTTQNKILFQGDFCGPNRPATNGKCAQPDGFPTRVEELFDYEGLIIGSVDAPYLTTSQQELIKEFVDRRGGGVLFLGGRDSLADGGWKKSPVNEILPTILPDSKNTFVRVGANVELTSAGRDNLITRIEEDPDKNVERWKKLPYIMNFQNPGQPKPGAVVLADAIPTAGGGGHIPLLTVQNFGRGRVALFATGGSWRWQMLQPVADKSHEMFYTQLLRWLVNDTPRHVTGSTPRTLLADESKVKLRAEVRDKTFMPAGDATVEAHILGEGAAEQVTMTPEPLEQGVYGAEWTTPKAGSYIVEVVAKRGSEEIGRDTFTFRREDGVAENFHVEQNRELLQKLSDETGGRYYKPGDAQSLAKDITYSEAGITVRETRDLWDMPALFLILLGIMAVEWTLRRRWGVI